eukprot:1143063-Pelagomonas_calceolata.AAC.2
MMQGGARRGRCLSITRAAILTVGKASAAISSMPVPPTLLPHNQCPCIGYTIAAQANHSKQVKELKEAQEAVANDRSKLEALQNELKARRAEVVAQEKELAKRDKEASKRASLAEKEAAQQSANLTKKAEQLAEQQAEVDL